MNKCLAIILLFTATNASLSFGAEDQILVSGTQIEVETVMNFATAKGHDAMPVLMKAKSFGKDCAITADGYLELERIQFKARNLTFKEGKASISGYAIGVDHKTGVQANCEKRGASPFHPNGLGKCLAGSIPKTTPVTIVLTKGAKFE